MVTNNNFSKLLCLPKTFFLTQIGNFYYNNYFKFWKALGQ